MSNIEATEADGANQSVDMSVAAVLNEEQAQPKQRLEVDEEVDRLGLVKKVPAVTYWQRVNEATPHEEETRMAIAEESESAQRRANEEDSELADTKEWKFPFGDGEVVYAYYGDDAKNVLFFVLRQPDTPIGPGPIETIRIDKADQHRAAWYWIHKEFGSEQIQKNTQREINKLNRLREKAELADKDATAKQITEELFQAKIEAFELDVVRNSPHKKLKSAIRRSKTLMEVTANIGAVIALDNMVEVNVDGGDATVAAE
jgi:hypothetical protein